MASIHIQPDCGNSPRKLFLKDLNIAFVNGDIAYITRNIPSEITWQIVGQKSLKNKKSYLDELERNGIWKAKELTIDTIITHGPDASVSGKITATDNRKFSFCDIYRFRGAGGTIIKSIKTFIIEEQ